MRRLPILLAAAFVAAAIPRVAHGGASEDPSPVFGERSLHVLHVPFLDFGPADPAAPEPGAVSWTVESAYASTFSSTWHALSFHKNFGLVGQPFTQAEADAIHRDFPGDRVFFLASDLLRASVSARAGLTRTLSVSVEVVYVSHDAIRGGSAVEAFHRAFGLPQSGREEFPSDAFDVVLQRPNGPISFDGRTPASGFGDTTATLSWRPTRVSLWSYGVDGAIKAPTGRSRDDNGSGSWDGGALAFLRRDGTRWAFDGEAGLVAPGRWHSETGLSVAWFSRLLLGATRSFGARTRVGMSATLEQSPFRRDGLGDVSHPGLEIALGLERTVSSRAAASLTVTENAPSFGDRADFGLALRIRLK
ncbi:MAG: DUF3187 family protein [Thermoanaerobaculia bacterium]